MLPAEGGVSTLTGKPVNFVFPFCGFIQIKKGLYPAVKIFLRLFINQMVAHGNETDVFVSFSQFVDKLCFLFCSAVDKIVEVNSGNTHVL